MIDPLQQQLEDLAARSGKPVEAFLWVLQALEHTRQRLRREGHVTARELLDGQRDLALQKFGPMAYDVLSHWGRQPGPDIGQLVFAMVEAGLLAKTDEDGLADFHPDHEFPEAFVKN